MLLRAFLVWLAIIPLAILNGGLRDVVLAPRLGPIAARTLSGITLGVIIFGWSWLTVDWIGLQTSRAALAVGGAWFTLTVIFEFGFGRLVAKKSWAELLRAYRFEGGDLWPLVLLSVALAPLFAHLLRRT